MDHARIRRGDPREEKGGIMWREGLWVQGEVIVIKTRNELQNSEEEV